MKKALRWFVKLVKQVIENDLQNHAAEMAYFGMMAVFPFFLLLTAGVAFLPIPDLFGEAMTLLRQLAPSRAVDLLEGTIHEITTNRKDGLVALSSVLCVWMSAGAMSSTTRGLNKAFGLRDPRHYGRFFGLSLILTLLLGVLLIVAILLILIGPLVEQLVADRIPEGELGLTLLAAFRYFVITLVLFAAHAGVYWLCPAMKRRFRLFTPGTIFAVVAWLAVSSGLQLYLSRFDNYDKLYGGLGAVILLLVWFYVMSFVLLLGGQIDAILHPEYKMPITESGDPVTQPFPFKLATVGLLVVISIPLAIKLALEPGSFTPAPRAIGGDLGEAVRQSQEEGTEAFDHAAFTEILKRWVDEKGGVDYVGLQAEMQPLTDYIDALAAVDLGTLARDELHAMLLNLYNAVALRRAAERQDQILSYKDIPDANSRPTCKLGGRDLSMDELRHRLLRFHFQDPRDQFALNDGSKSAPRLSRSAYDGKNLEEQLERATREALAPIELTEERGKKRIELPAIVSFYLDDFEPQGGVVKFLERYLPDAPRAVLERDGSDALHYRNYDWSLNRRSN